MSWNVMVVVLTTSAACCTLSNADGSAEDSSAASGDASPLQSEAGEPVAADPWTLCRSTVSAGDWTAQSSPLPDRGAIAAIHASSEEHIFVAGSANGRATLVVGDGDQWRSELLVPEAEYFVSLSGYSGAELVATASGRNATRALWRRSGTGTWSREPAPPPGMLLHGVTPESLWALDGAVGRVFSQGPRNWSQMSLPHTGQAFQLNTIRATGPDAAWVGGYVIGSDTAVLIHLHGSHAQSAALPTPDGPGGMGSIAALWASDENDIWAGGGSVLMHFDGLHWTQHPIVTQPTGQVITSIWGACAQDVWAVGYDTNTSSAGFALHFDGVTWARYPLSWTSAMVPIAVTATPTRLFLVARGGAAHWLFSRPR